MGWHRSGDTVCVERIRRRYRINPRRFRHVWFDLSGVWTDKSSAADKQTLVALIRRIGLRHFLPGSDWPYNGDNLADYYNRVYPDLLLTQSEWGIIRRNVAPYAR
jgi:hypothetical protein